MSVNAEVTRRIVGIDRHEARGILNCLLEWRKKPGFMVHHQWPAGGIAIWDNRSTRHCALADYWPHHRVNPRMACDEPGAAAEAALASKKALRGAKLR